MVTYNLGSVSDRLWGMIDDIPSTISGATMLNMIDNERNYMEAFLNVSIGSTAIEEKFQPALISLSAASILRSMQLEGVDAASISLGDFSESKGSGSNVGTAISYYAEDAEKKLNVLKMQNFHFYKANG